MDNLINKQVGVLDKGYVQLLDLMPHPLTKISPDTTIVNAARVSVLGETKGLDDDARLINYLMKNAHTSPFEMVELKFRVKAPIFIARQWMRHRMASYNEVSRRYTSDRIEVYIPDEWRGQASNNKQASAGIIPDTYLTDEYERIVYQCVDQYHLMLKAGVAREMARSILPQSLYTEFIWKVDAHNLMHFLKLRMHEHAQKEIRDYADAIYNHFFKPYMPITAMAFEEHILKRKDII